MGTTDYTAAERQQRRRAKLKAIEAENAELRARIATLETNTPTPPAGPITVASVRQTIEALTAPADLPRTLYGQVGTDFLNDALSTLRMLLAAAYDALPPDAPERRTILDALDLDGEPWPGLTYEAVADMLEARGVDPDDFRARDRLERDTGWHCPIHGISYDGTYRTSGPLRLWDQIKLQADAAEWLTGKVERPVVAGVTHAPAPVPDAADTSEPSAIPGHPNYVNGTPWRPIDP